MIVPSKPCTVRRYLALVASPLSQSRFFMHEKLSGLSLPGKAIDIGGTKNSSYRGLLRTESELVTLNISAEHGGGADILADCNKPLPIEDNSFDSLLSVTMLEHIHNDEFAVREAMRILKPGGYFHILVPFLYREHGCPYDFHRHTAQWWNEFLQALSLHDASFTVEPLVWDAFATGASFFETYSRFLRPVVRAVFCFPCVLAPFLNKKDRTFADMNATGLYISGIKSWTVSGKL